MKFVYGKWRESPAIASPELKVSLKSDKQSCRHLGITPPYHKLPNIDLKAIADTGAEICILPESEATALNIEL